MRPAYCAISGIYIGQGQECGIIPLSIADHHYRPTALPIFGKYKEYGGLYDIEITPNVKLIEEYFGMNIYNFITYVDGNSRNTIIPPLNNQKELDTWEYAYVDKQVYDFISAINYTADHKQHKILSKTLFLEHLGAKNIGDNLYEYNGYTLKKRDEYLEIDGFTVYTIADFDNSIGLPEHLKYLLNISSHRLYYYYEKKSDFKGDTYYAFTDNLMESLFAKDTWLESGINMDGSKLWNKYPNKFYHLYYDDIPTYGDSIGRLTTIHHNFGLIAKTWLPYYKAVIQQYGVYEEYTKIINKFLNINKQYEEQEKNNEDEDL
jgi:hypothetical protein